MKENVYKGAEDKLRSCQDFSLSKTAECSFYDSFLMSHMWSFTCLLNEESCGRTLSSDDDKLLDGNMFPVP